MKIETRTKIYKILMVIILIMMFFFMCYEASRQSFWSDELDWTIKYIAQPSFLSMLHDLLLLGYNLPLYYIVLFPIYRIVPYGEMWLLLLNIILMIMGIIRLKKTGEKIGEIDLGFFTFLMVTISSVLMQQGVFELRPYTFLFIFSIYTLYYYISKTESNNRKNIIFYTIFIVLLSYSHWFGCLMISFYFLTDLLKFLTKRIKIKFIIPYVILLLFFLPWLYLVFKYHITDFTSYWIEAPKYSDIPKVIAELLSNNIAIYLFVISILIYIYSKIRSKKLYKHYSLLISSVVYIIGIIFIYSKYINPKCSFFLVRYFLVVLPHIFILISIPLTKLIHFKININNKKIIIKEDKKINIPILLCLIFIIIYTGYGNYKWIHQNGSVYNEPYKEISNKLYNDKDIYSENTAVITSYGTGYLYYYFEKQHKIIPRNVFVTPMQKYLYKVIKIDSKFTTITIQNNQILNYKKLYIIETHKDFNDDFWNFIESNYKLIDKNPKLNMYIYVKK